MTKLGNWNLLLFFFFAAQLTYGQTSIIKVKKEKSESSDTCNFRVIISSGLSGKRLKFNSVEMDQNYKSEITSSDQFSSILSNVNEYIDIRQLALREMFSEVCSINSYKLKAVEVKRHEANKANYHNCVDIILMYSK